MKKLKFNFDEEFNYNCINIDLFIFQLFQSPLSKNFCKNFLFIKILLL